MADTTPQLAALLEHAGWVRELARGLVADPGRADDLTQETWRVALERPPADLESPRGWLAAVLRSRARTRGRRDALRREREELAARDEAWPDPGDVLARADVHRRVVEHLLRLEEPFRQALLSRYFDELSVCEIAKRLGVPEATVRSRLRRGLERLRARLDAASCGDRRAWLGGLAALARPEPAGAPPAVGSVLGGLLVNANLKLLSAALLVAAGALVLPRLLQQDVESRPSAGDDVAVAAPQARPPVPAASPEASPDPVAARAALVGEASIPAGIEITGRVLRRPYPGLADEERPDAGVAVRVGLALPGEPEWIAERIPVTDGQGRFRVPFADPGTRPLALALSVDADDEYRELWQLAELAEGRRLDLTLRRAAHGALEARCVDAAGRPLPGVRLVVPEGGRGGSELVALADGAGRARLGPLVALEDLRVRLPGHVPFELEDSTRIDTGGWEPIRVVLARAGRLTLALEDDAGAPLEGVRVTATVAREEPRELSGPFGGRGRGPRAIGAISDAEGRVRFEELWTEKRLQLHLWHDGVVRAAERALAGELVLGSDATSGEPIVIPAVEPLELHARLRGALVVRGRVMHEDGSPVVEPQLLVRVLAAEGELRRTPAPVPAGDADGRFELRLPHAFRGLPLAITASDGPIDRYDLSGRATFEHAIESVLEAEATLTGAVELDLVVRPALAITGDLVDAEGEPVPGSVHAVPSGASWPFAPAAYGQESFHWTLGGAFALHGLPAGRYDLYATRPGILPTAIHRVASVPAGTHGLELVVPDGREVTVRVSARAPGGELARMTVFLEALHPRGAAPDVPTAPRAQVVRSLSGFPEGARLGYKGNDLRRDAQGLRFRAHLETAQLDGYELPRLQPGWYTVGVVGRGADGEPYHPTAVGPLRFAAGEHELTFELVRTATVRGRLRSSADPAQLVARLVDETGAAVPVRDAQQRAAREVPLAADGRFALPGAPAASCRLWIGSPEQLERGEPLVERALELRPGENPPLELTAP